MSDLFVGEILILFLLLPVMLRPFFRRLQRVEGISLLPLLAFLLAIMVIAAVGLALAFVPVFLFVFLVLLSELARVSRFFRHLPTDWYSPPAKVYYGFLLMLFVGVFCGAVFFAPEAIFFSGKDVRRVTVNETISPGARARITTWTAPTVGEAAKKSPIVILVEDFSSGAGGRRTTASILAENGYTVIEADFGSLSDFKNPVLSVPVLRKFLFRLALAFPGIPAPAAAGETMTVQLVDLDRLVRLVRDRYGADVRVFAVAEGSACKATVARMRAEPRLFAGVVCIVPAGNPGFDVPGEAIEISAASGSMPSSAGTYPICVLSGDRATLYGYGEMAADDVLAAIRCGSVRDSGRKQAEFTARRISSWLSMRSKHDDQ
jgi:hypothetical protein